MRPFDKKKNKDGVDLRKYRYFENILFELGAVDYSCPPIFILRNTILGKSESFSRTGYVNHSVYITVGIIFSKIITYSEIKYVSKYTNQ
jgi:hypothetical protein